MKCLYQTIQKVSQEKTLYQIYLKFGETLGPGQTHTNQENDDTSELVILLFKTVNDTSDWRGCK